MVLIAIILGCVLGAILGINAPMISYTYSSYLAIAIMSFLVGVLVSEAVGKAERRTDE